MRYLHPREGRVKFSYTYNFTLTILNKMGIKLPKSVGALSSTSI